jgi:hypothetical protein
MNEVIIEEPSHSYTMKGGKVQKRKKSLTMPRMLTMDVFKDDDMLFERSQSPVQMVSEDMMDAFYDQMLDKYDVTVEEYKPPAIIYKDPSGNQVGYQKVYSKTIIAKPKKKTIKKKKPQKKKTRKARN